MVPVLAEGLEADLAAIASHSCCNEWCNTGNCSVMRIRAALASLAHLEEGARLLAVDAHQFAGMPESEMVAHWVDTDKWRETEAKRLEKTT